MENIVFSGEKIKLTEFDQLCHLNYIGTNIDTLSVMIYAGIYENINI